MPTIKDQMETGRLAGGMTFSAVRRERLGASEYTLATVLIDDTGSVSPFADQLREMILTAIDALRRSPHSENVLVRVARFNACYPNGVNELHGFKPLADISEQDYPRSDPTGGTPLYDAVFNGVAATNAYAQNLYDGDLNVNAITIIVTDGVNTYSMMTPAAIKAEIGKVITQEVLESHRVILIGINAQLYQAELQAFKQDVGITNYLDAGDATPTKLAKLAEFIAQSVSLTSQALGTGGPSQSIPAII